MDTKDLKGFLYGWLGKRKIGQPSYSITSSSRGGTERFKCELRVPGHTYIGLGNSLNKKDAATNAAMDFCYYLVRQKLLDAAEIPALNESSLEATNTSSSSDARGFVLDSSKTSFSKFESNQSNENVRIAQSSNFFALPTSYDQYVKQKAEEIAQSESVDLVSEIHGGWTMDNSKKALNEFLQKLRQPPIVYSTNFKEANNCRTFVSEASIFVPQLRKQISGRGQGSAKKVAESGCAMAIVRQLFHLGIMAEFKGERRKTTVANLPEIPLTLPAPLIERVNTFIKASGVKPIVVNSDLVSSESPQSLICNYKLDQFPECEVFPAGNISWAPPMQNWNPWHASNIDEPPLAFMSLKEISAKIAEKEAYKPTNIDMRDKRMDLPVTQYKQQILDTVQENRVTLIKGETGCGKSTQVAQYLLDYFVSVGRGAEFNAFISQPRRISAISLAERVSAERGEELGETIGYGVRFDSVSPRPYGAMMFCTVGVLLRKMESGLRGVSHIIIDEIHERDVNTDFVLVVLREMVREYSDLRVILMSATIDTKLFTEFFGGCPVIEMQGRTHPVEHYFLEDVISMLKYMPPPPEKRMREDDEEIDDKGKNLNLLVSDVTDNVRQAMSYISEREIPLGVIEAILIDISSRDEPGSVLIFLPGWSEIMLVMNFLNYHNEFSKQSKYVILPLHSQLTGAEQRKVFEHYSSNIRKIILSTNIAETSVTIDDVVFVIDSCKVKERMYTSSNNMVHFATVWASRTNLMQRRGRAGRVRPGFTFHLCSKQRFDALDEHRTAEILRTPLHEIALTIKLLRLGSVGDFLAKAIEPPPYDMVVESEAVLQNMSALDNKLELTNLGRILARLPIEPLMGKTIILGIALGIGSLMCDIAAASSFSIPFIPRERAHARLTSGQRSFAGTRWSDHVALIAVNQAYKEAEEVSTQAEQSFCNRFSLSQTILKMTGGAKRQLIDVLSTQCGFPMELLSDTPVNSNGPDQKLDLLTSLLVSALYPNICYYRGKRKVYTLEQASALIAKSSVLTPFQGDNEELPSPLLVFTEKLRTRIISCKQLSVISAVQLLIFGCRKVECVGSDLVRLDEMITIKMDVSLAAALVALRPCIDALLVRTCCNPSSLLVVTEHDQELCALLRDLSSNEFFVGGGPIKDHLLTDAAQVMSQPINIRRGWGGHRRDRGFANSFGMGSSRGDISYENMRMEEYGNDEVNRCSGGSSTTGGCKWNKGSPRRGNNFIPYPTGSVRPRWRPRGRGAWL